METNHKYTPLVLETEITGDPDKVDKMMEKVLLRVRRFLVYFETVDGMKVTARLKE